MRLLQREDNDRYSLAEFHSPQIPPYAILSHRWGPDYEEVTYKDLIEGANKSKVGYEKLHFCAKQTAKDGLQYFWIDTCCIDKSSSAELSEAINSMFRWYNDATICYVYLSDVVGNQNTDIGYSSYQSLDSAFRASKWFTRGWTLQELIAPRSIEFFSAQGERLGDKNSLEREIYDITGIPIAVLQGSHLSTFSVEERMSWVAKRETKREEDIVYSLLGIFNVHMSPIYGEGRENAFRRLRKEITESSQGETSDSPRTFTNQYGISIHVVPSVHYFASTRDDMLLAHAFLGTFPPTRSTQCIAMK
jgi:hypothetical protein